ncbi:MAG TPA: BMP family ABC transporter substrate-binding protein [Prolixibacteraceae bacterium]|nr:BMP family ABC transporter substrate-binding protein [Prolixibacteraceae bacterium]
MKKFFIYFILSLPVIGSFTSCDKKDENQTKLKIGMFVVGNGYNDSGYKQNCQNGLLMALKENAFDTLFVSSLTHTQDEIDYFPKKGCDALFLAGSLASEELLKTAASYPETQFVMVDYDYDGTLPNVQSITYNSDEAAFPLGYIAAYWAFHQDEVNPAIGIVGGMDIPAVERFMVGYNQGISYFNSQYSKHVTVMKTFLNSFDDSIKGYEVADSLIKKCSADVILPVAGAASNGSVYAAKNNGKWAIGTDADQFYSMPDVASIMLSSCMKRTDTTIYSVATTFLSNPVISHSTYTGTLKNEGVSLAPFHNFDSQIPDSIKTAIEIIKKGIIAGSIHTGF